MRIGEVVGRLTLNRCDPKMIGGRFLIVRPHDPKSLREDGMGKGEIVVNATDLLNTMQVRRTIRGTDFTFVSTDYLETQVIRAGYNWKF